MKRAVPILLVSICCISSAAKLSFQANAPRGYDNVERHLISLASPGQCSSLAIWNLGNNRVVLGENGAIEQVNHYYPFGGLMGESKSLASSQRYKYNGKELDRTHGLDWYDYGARMYDPALARWMAPDPLAEKYYGVSPYAYCGDNPINAMDPDGKNPIFNTRGEYIGMTKEGYTDWANLCLYGHVQA